ncbi:FkbM family methyltransferase [Vreelandella venusta]|uniref:FkbM family methyltransferase n=1 Tax=Vreelandella venusta TaxID=44935 RepID=UPI0018DA37A8|nr:FkbM family methyltransferase [Halomonas venusta]QPI62911.1 FkbM family methyltransferase [Halomonas venusta]
MDCFLYTAASISRNKITAEHEPVQPFFFLSFLEFANVEVVLDIGANVGLYSLASTIPKNVRCVYSFEPDEASYRELEKNIALNCLSSVILPFQFAISNSNGNLSFGTFSPMSGVNSVINTSIHNSAVFSEISDVPAITLDEIEGISGKVLGIKIDVEGHELEVIDGAKNLLVSSPTVIQIEHYVGSCIDETLRKIGYFCFLIAGHDHYFTNIRNFTNPLFVKRAVDYASTWFIETNAGRWPNLSTIKNSLSLSCSFVDEEIHAQASLVDGFFSDPEFAFYLIVNGEKVDEQWYRPIAYAIFNAPDYADSIELKAFAREKNSLEKKVMVGSFLKQPAIGYRAESAVGESLGLPSVYSSIVHRLGRAEFDYPALNHAPLLDSITSEIPEHLIVVGDSSDFEVFVNLYKKKLSRLSVFCLPCKTAFNNEEGKQVGFFEVQSIYKNITVYSPSSAIEFINNINFLLSRLNSACHFLIRGQFLSDLGVDIDEMMLSFSNFPSGSKIYTEGLSNASYKCKVLEFSDKYDLAVEWLYSRSEIISPEEINNSYENISMPILFQNEKLSFNDMLDFSSTSLLEENCVHTLGLDFSLPED